MEIAIRSAQEDDIQPIVEMVNRFAAQNIMLPRTEESVRKTLADWLVAVEKNTNDDSETLVGCGALVPLNDKLVEIRSVAVHETQHGKGRWIDEGAQPTVIEPIHTFAERLEHRFLA